MSQRPICFIDTETTSLHPLHREAWEIAILRREHDGSGGWEQRHHHFFVYVDLTHADQKSLDIGRYFERHPDPDRRNAGTYVLSWNGESSRSRVYSPMEAARKVRELTHGATIVGAVPDFDTRTLSNLLVEHGFTPTWHHRLVCVEALTAGFLRRTVAGLAESADQLGIRRDDLDAHTAEDDAVLAQRIYDYIIRNDRTHLVPAVAKAVPA